MGKVGLVKISTQTGLRTCIATAPMKQVPRHPTSSSRVLRCRLQASRCVVYSWVRRNRRGKWMWKQLAEVGPEHGPHFRHIMNQRYGMVLQRQIRLVIYRLLHLPIMSPEYVLNISNILKHAYWLGHALPRQRCKVACAP